MTTFVSPDLNQGNFTPGLSQQHFVLSRYTASPYAIVSSLLHALRSLSSPLARDRKLSRGRVRCNSSSSQNHIQKEHGNVTVYRNHRDDQKSTHEYRTHSLIPMEYPVQSLVHFQARGTGNFFDAV